MTELGPFRPAPTTRSFASPAPSPTSTAATHPADHLNEAINYRMLDRHLWT